MKIYFLMYWYKKNYCLKIKKNFNSDLLFNIPVLTCKVVPGRYWELSLHVIKVSKVAWLCLILFEVPSISLFQLDINTYQHHAECISLCVYSVDLYLEPTGI